MTTFSWLLKTGFSSYVSEPSSGSPIPPINDAQKPLSSYEKYLGNCAIKLFPDCGNQVFQSVFLGNQTISNECCINLVKDVGQHCHDDLTKYILTTPKFKANKVSIWQRSKKIWNDCISFSLDISPSPTESVGVSA